MAPSELDLTFTALADPTRRAILARLVLGEASVNELAEPFAMSQPAISKHLKVLERAGLIARGRDAQRRPCRIVVTPLTEIDGWLETYRELWERRYEALDDLLETLQAEAAPPAASETATSATSTNRKSKSTRRKQS